MHSDLRFELCPDGAVRPRLGGPVDGVLLLTVDDAAAATRRPTGELLAQWLAAFGGGRGDERDPEPTPPPPADVSGEEVAGWVDPNLLARLIDKGSGFVPFLADPPRGRPAVRVLLRVVDAGGGTPFGRH